MRKNKDKIEYFLYARKSSESEDRQVQSINDQIDRLKELADSYGIKIKKVFTEAKSAKKPNNRPLFTEMLEKIQDGAAQGILCWQINRLSRNPIDSAQIQWLLQQQILKSIQTIDRQYLPDDNVLLFNVESGMANQFILDLKKNVKRGIESKCQKGWMPGIPPLGYLNDKVEKTIVKDKNTFDLIRKMWDLMLTGAYTPPQIVKIANEEWGFRTRKTKKCGNVPLSKSGIYKIFNNLFYTGSFIYGGREYQGKHEAMITLDEFDKVQIILGKKGNPRAKSYEYPYTGIIKCGYCGGMVTVERKTKFIKSTGKTKTYIYYHCTRNKKGCKCSQPSITGEELEKQIDEKLKKSTILPEFKKWALDAINKNNDQEIQDKTKIYEMQHKNLTKTQKELDNLSRMRYKEMIDDDFFLSEKNKLQKEIRKIQEKLRQTEKRAEDWIELTEKAFNFATYARIKFKKGDLNTKKEILRTVGTEITLKDKTLNFSGNKWLSVIEDKYLELEREYRMLEPHKNVQHSHKSEAIASLRTRWLAYRDSFRTFLMKNNYNSPILSNNELN